MPENEPTPRRTPRRPATGGDQEALHKAKGPAHALARLEAGKVDYLDDKGVCDLLSSKKLLGKQFLYAAVPYGAEEFTRINGTYCSTRGAGKREPLNTIFCCELIDAGRERTIVQVGAPEHSLLDYLKQNGGDTTASIAVYDRSKLKQSYFAQSNAEFEFVVPSSAPSALVAIVTIKNFAG